jgi:GNAT superfamily N-acetyltransferase
LDTTEIRLCVAGADDRERVARFLAAMDRDGLYQRHFAHGEAPNRALLARLAASDLRDRVGILALDRDGEVMGHAEYVAVDGSAEYALMLLPRVRGLGLGRRLLAALLDLATATGQRELHGIIQAGNTPALQLSLRLEFRIEPGADRTTVIVSRELAPARFAASGRNRPGAADYQTPPALHDPDRTPLYRFPFPRAPFRARRRKMQCRAADAFGGGEEA